MNEVEDSASGKALFPEEFKPLDDWIAYCSTELLNSDIGAAIMATLTDIATIIKDGSDVTRAHFRQHAEGMWDLLKAYANTKDISILTCINDLLKQTLIFLKGFEAAYPVIAKSNAINGTKRPIDLDGEFKYPLKTARVIKFQNSNPVTTSNSFDNLTEMTEITGDTVTDRTTQPIPKEPRPEPFYVKVSHNWREISTKIDEIANCKVYKKVQDTLIKFFPSTIEIYRKIQSYLTDNNIEFFGMRLKTERPRKVLLKGIPIDFPISEIKDELISLGYNVHRVSQLKNFRTKLPMPIFLVDVFVNDKFRHIFETRNILGFFIKVEAYKFKGAKQCYNCQLFNHSSEFCFLKPVCLKCSGGHNVKQCTVTDRSGIKCANCGANHTANFGGCPKNPKNLKNSRVTTIRNSNQMFIPKPVNKSQSFANIAKGVDVNLTSSAQNINMPKSSIATTSTFSNVSSDSNVNSVNFHVPSVNNSNLSNMLNISQTAKPIDQSNLLNFIASNDNFDTVLDKLNKLCNLLEKFQNLCADKNVNDILAIFGLDKLASYVSKN